MARKRDPEASRAAIELAAAELFADHGYAGTSTSSIAKKAGVAEGTIFRHFPTKKALLLGVVRPLITTFFAPIATRSLKALFARRYSSLEELLEALWDDRVRLVVDHPHIAQIFVQEASLHPEIVQLMSSVFRAHVLPPFRAQIEQLRADGLIAEDLPPEIVIQHVVATIGTTLLSTQVFGIDLGRDLDELKPYLIRLVCRGLAP